MEYYYSTNKNVQILIALLKAHNINKVIASPGTTNLELMASLQSDSFFQMYSCVDERSAAYMACGLAAETGEPVMITCTEATASRNYFSGMTEAYHRKLPILAVTGLHEYSYIGNLEPQVIDRDNAPSDTMKLKVHLPVIKDENDIWESELKINKALLELRHRGGGPVHIDIPWNGGNFDFSVQELPAVRVINRYSNGDVLPPINKGRVAVYIGTHSDWSEEDTKALDAFCKKNNAVAICDHSCKYYGKYRVQTALLSLQKTRIDVLENIDLLIHIGEETGDDASKRRIQNGVKEVWRVSIDGELRDTFKKLTNVFEMDERDFFQYYSDRKDGNDSYLQECKELLDSLYSNIPSLPFSSMYVASKIAPALPEGSAIHFGVSDTIRAWTMFNLPKGVRSYANTGCRGIDGCVSSLIGASFANPNKTYFGVFGDLTFFYDLNSLGNRYIGNNVRIILLNNDGGNIFRHTGHPAQTWLGFEQANLYIAASGHFGKKSPELVKNYAENLGFEYISASNKSEFDAKYEHFVSPEKLQKPILFEIFSDSASDNQGFDLMADILKDSSTSMKKAIKQVLGKQGTAFVKKIIKH
ncbi:MAG: thiamine pyrophosphate-binding protein [Oscillospiraceae bacterium]|nr:thiamine pyrophosphate-binding protein [Oscillospiraceae bacterium]